MYPFCFSFLSSYYVSLIRYIASPTSRLLVSLWGILYISRHFAKGAVFTTSPYFTTSSFLNSVIGPDPPDSKF
jgi:hypothetical protein